MIDRSVISESLWSCMSWIMRVRAMKLCEPWKHNICYQRLITEIINLHIGKAAIWDSDVRGMTIHRWPMLWRTRIKSNGSGASVGGEAFLRDFNT